MRTETRPHRRTAALTALVGALAVAAVPEPGWTPVLPLAGTWEASLAVADEDTLFLSVDNVSEVGASRSVVLRSDDGGGTWSPTGQPLTSFSTLVAHDEDTLALRAQVGGILTSVDGGASWVRPPSLAQASAVAFDDDGSLWGALGANACTDGTPAVTVLAPSLDRVRRTVDLPDGWYPYREVVPGPGGGVVAAARSCDPPARVTLLLSDDDGATWQRVGDRPDLALPPRARWVGADTVVVPAGGLDLLVLRDVGGDGPVRSEVVTVPDLPGPDGLLAGRISDLSVAGDVLVTTSTSGTVARTVVGPDATAPFEVLRQRGTLALPPVAQVLADGTVVARVEHAVLERRRPDGSPAGLP